VVAVDPALSASEVAAFMAGVGKSVIVSQWERWWWKILIIGVMLYMAVNNVTYSTANVFLLPQLFMIGTFLVPIVYTAYLYEDGTLYDVPLSKIALVFFFGGVLGCLAASMLEARLITTTHTGFFGSMTASNALIVGLSEELAKLIVVLPFLFVARRQFPTVMHGIVLGAAAGMGFAAFESMGYAFLALISTPGDINQSIAAMHETIRLRALLAPLGHGTWTAIVAAAMWRDRVEGRSPLTLNTLIAFTVAVLLHAAWDYVPPVRLPLIDLPLMLLVLGLIGLLILRFFLGVAKGEQDGAYRERNLARALHMYFAGLGDEMRDKMRRPKNKEHRTGKREPKLRPENQEPRS
jgi:RsiW-degrading membrane proteinase PrsW (M82 family)